MLLFIIGMEMRLQSFRKSLPLALGVTAVTIADHRLSVALFTVFVHGEVMGGVVIGFMLSISSTAVAMKMIEDAGEKDTPAGRLARGDPGGAGSGGGAAAADHQRAGRGRCMRGTAGHRAASWRWRWRCWAASSPC